MENHSDFTAYGVIGVAHFLSTVHTSGMRKAVVIPVLAVAMLSCGALTSSTVTSRIAALADEIDGYAKFYDSQVAINPPIEAAYYQGRADGMHSNAQLLRQNSGEVAAIGPVDPVTPPYSQEEITAAGYDKFLQHLKAQAYIASFGISGDPANSERWRGKMEAYVAMVAAYQAPRPSVRIAPRSGPNPQ